MRTIELGGRKARGRVALIDDADYELVSRHKWHVFEQDHGPGRRPGGPYARTNIPRPGGGRRTIFMHNLILGIRGIDHANANGLDNQRHNLRVAGQSLNNANKRPVRRQVSRFKGIHLHEYGKWEARIRFGGRNRYLGLFADGKMLPALTTLRPERNGASTRASAFPRPSWESEVPSSFALSAPRKIRPAVSSAPPSR